VVDPHAHDALNDVPQGSASIDDVGAVPDEQRRLVDAIKAGAAKLGNGPDLLDPFEYVASANYVVPMLVHLATVRANELVDQVPRYSSQDHAVIWNDLLVAIARFGEHFVMPYFSTAAATDPFAQALLQYEHGKQTSQHYIASFERGLWSLVRDEQGLRIRLSEPMRRSALHLLANKARSLATPENVLGALRVGLDEASVEELALVAGTHDLRVFAESCPEAWEQLQDGLPFAVELLPGFRAFLIDLGRHPGSRWATPKPLEEAWVQYAAEHRLPGADADIFRALLEFHSLTLEEAQSWGIQAPFLRFGDTYMAWFFVYHVLSPNLHFLSLLARRYEQLWGRTVGANLERVADWLGGQLPAVSRLKWAARRRRKGVGEADLVLLDTDTGHVLVIELKTVFDKFRTHLQMTNFTEQKVNFPKAIVQAQTAALAIRDGQWTLHDIFGKDVPEQPSVVTPMVLTWWDTFNPTLGTDAPTLCCNFDTLLFLLNRAEGDVGAVVLALEELSSVYCPGVLVPAGVYANGEDFEFRIETQSDVLPPIADLERLISSPLAREAISDLPVARDVADLQPEEGPELFRYPVRRS
jgi:hypothetical protein